MQEVEAKLQIRAKLGIYRKDYLSKINKASKSPLSASALEAQEPKCDS